MEPRPLDHLRELAGRYREHQREGSALRHELAREVALWRDEGMTLGALVKATGLTPKVVRGLLASNPPPALPPPIPPE